jgi:hypothetical protein
VLYECVGIVDIANVLEQIVGHLENKNKQQQQQNNTEGNQKMKHEITTAICQRLKGISCQHNRKFV